MRANIMPDWRRWLSSPWWQRWWGPSWSSAWTCWCRCWWTSQNWPCTSPFCRWNVDVIEKRNKICQIENSRRSPKWRSEEPYSKFFYPDPGSQSITDLDLHPLSQIIMDPTRTRLLKFKNRSECLTPSKENIPTFFPRKTVLALT